jgi:nucleotide-binding universal stress UspA family protein
MAELDRLFPGKALRSTPMSIQRVLCPIDFSEHSRRALHHAQTIATWYDAELHVLHVRQIVMPLEVPPQPLTTPIVLAGVEPAEPSATLDAFIQETGCARPVCSVVRDGWAAAGIVDYAVEAGADLLVIGTHGRTGIDRLLLGSTAERVVADAPCPVLSIPPGGDEPGSAERVRFTHVLCAVDFSTGSMRALERGLSLAQEYGARVTLLHVVELPPKIELVVEMGAPAQEYMTRKARDAQECLAAAVPSDARAWCDVRVIVRPGRPAPVILQEAEAHNADLIVMGSQGHHGLSLAVLGSATQTVVRGANCPVLTAGSATGIGARTSSTALLESVPGDGPADPSNGVVKPRPPVAASHHPPQSAL